MKLFEDTIGQVHVNEIIPNKINPNTMPGMTFDKLKLSIQKLGQMLPIVVRHIKDDEARCECEKPEPKEDINPRCENCNLVMKDAKVKYEIIDGEWRWRATRAIGRSEIQSKIIEATQDEIAGLIFASTIKGKHDVYATTGLISELVKTEDSDTLKAMNLDRGKIERKIKYHGSDKVKPIVKGRRGDKHFKEEKDSYNVKTIDNYRRLVLLSDAPNYCHIIDGKIVLKPNEELKEELKC